MAHYLILINSLLRRYEDTVFRLIEKDGRLDGLQEDLMIAMAGLPAEANLHGGLIAVTRAQSKSTETQVRALGIPQRDTPELAALLDQWRSEQIGKIVSLTNREAQKLRRLLDENQGLHPNELRKLIQERFAVTKSKAALLARDQTITLSTKLSQRKMEDAGVTEYIWTTAQDEHVRDIHKELEGTRHKFSDPPIISEDGRRGNPGDDYQCRCVAFPVMDEFEGI